MTEVIADFESGTNGATIGATDDVLSGVNGGDFGDTAALYDNTYSASGSGKCAKFTGNSGTAWRTLSLTATSTVHVGAYFKVDDNTPTANFTILQVKSATTNRATVQLMTAGTLRLRNGTATVVTSTYVVQPNTPLRIDWEINGTTSQMRLNLFYGANINGTTPDEVTAWGAYNQGTFDNVAFGQISSPGNATVSRYDRVGYNTAAQVTPYTAPGSDIICDLDFEGGTNGAALTTTESGYTVITNTSPVYSAAEAVTGSLGVLADLSAQSQNCRVTWSSPGNNIYYRRYGRFKRHATSQHYLLSFWNAATQRLCSIGAEADGGIRLFTGGSGSTPGNVSTKKFAVNEQFRLEAHVISGGALTVRLFWGSNLHGTTADETVTGTITPTDTMTEHRDAVNASSDVSVSWDAVKVSNANWVGPVTDGLTVDTNIRVKEGGVWLDAEVLIKEAGVWVGADSYVWDRKLVSVLPSDLLTNTARWAWANLGYAYPGTSFVAEAAGMRLNWNPSPSEHPEARQLGYVNMDTSGFVVGHTIRVEAVVSVPNHSDDVRLTHAYTSSGPYASSKTRLVPLVIEFVWAGGMSAAVGIESNVAVTGGEVLVLGMRAYDKTAYPTSDDQWVPDGPTYVDITAPTIPGAPVTTPSASTVGLTWDPAIDDSGVTLYEIYRATTSGGAGTLRGTSSSASYTDTSVPNGTWYYNVRAKDAAGNFGLLSDQTAAVVNASDVTAPTTPGQPTATPTGGSVALAWTASTDAVGVTGYEIHRSSVTGFTPDGTTLKATSATNSYTENPVATGTWYYRIIAYDAAGNKSAGSTQRSVVVTSADTTAPTTPGTPTASPTGSSVMLAWTASTDAVGVTAYDVHRSATSGFTPGAGTLKASPATNSYTEPGVPNGTWYYKIIARDAAGNSSTASGQRSVVVSASTAMLMGISTDNDGGGITNWSGYRVYNRGKMKTMANAEGGNTKPAYLAYSESGDCLSGTYTTYAATKAHVIAELNAFYYGNTAMTAGTGAESVPTPNPLRTGIKFYWSNGNENYKASKLRSVATFTMSMQGLYDGVHYIDPITGTRRFPDAYAGSDPTQDQEFSDDVQAYLHPTAQYHDFVMWSMYPGGRKFTVTDPRWDWMSFVESDRTINPKGVMIRCYYRTAQARAQARIDTGDPTRELIIGCGEIGMPSDPGDCVTRPYYITYGMAGCMFIMAAQYGLKQDFALYWDAKSSNTDPHNILSDEGPASDHGNTGTPNPTSAQSWQNWISYDTRRGGTKPAQWLSPATPRASWNQTGIPV